MYLGDSGPICCLCGAEEASVRECWAATQHVGHLQADARLASCCDMILIDVFWRASHQSKRGIINANSSKVLACRRYSATQN